MKKLTLLLVLLCFIQFNVLYGQNSQQKTGLSFKALFIDYQSRNGGDFSEFKSYHPGFEIGIHRNLGKNFNLNIPIIVGDVPSENGIDGFHKMLIGADLKLNYQFYAPERKLIPYILAGIGGVTEHDGEFNIQAPMGFGLNLKVADQAYINWQSEFRLSFKDDRDNFHHGLGFVYLFGKSKTVVPEPVVEEKPDSDGDGLIDEIDLCPQVAGPKELLGCPDTDGDGIADFEDACPEFPGPKELNGCPDTDGDGISDNEDECPNMAGTRENRGCPDVDKDDDGVPDDLDKCPDVPGPASNDGCPILDSDGDGIADEVDRCPNEPGSSRTMGCPDRDGDGIADFEDRCPSSPGLRVFGGCPDTDGDGIDDSRDQCPTMPGPIDNNGCPEIAEEDKQTLEIAMRAVQFDTGKSTLKPESFAILEQIEDILRRYRDFSLTVSGHTDSTGGAALNQRLSENRAKACYQYLIDQGISPSRLSYAGYGESRPISDNSSLTGRALNRRVEFKLIQ
jgi:outer membrane protein OmpA-like peptidoglycan-associated protein